MSEAIESIFEDGLLSLFDHYPIAFSTPSPSEPYIYRPTSIPSSSKDLEDDPSLARLEIPVYLPVAPSALHSTLQLTHIWLSSVLMADLIFSGHIDVKGKRICELGAGAGLPAAAAMLGGGARSVVSTDYAVPETETVDANGLADSEDVLGVLRGNLKRASELKIPDGREKTKDWAVLGHTWAEPVDDILLAPNRSDQERYDLLLLADLLWSSSSHQELIVSTRALIQPSTGVAHVIAGLHQGRGATERFKRVWKEGGGWVKEIDEFRWGRLGWERYKRGKGEVKDPEEERGVVVWFTAGID
jgi:predicted nicotinamide N-methyase